MTDFVHSLCMLECLVLRLGVEQVFDDLTRYSEEKNFLKSFIELENIRYGSNEEEIEY